MGGMEVGRFALKRLVRLGWWFRARARKIVGLRWLVLGWKCRLPAGRGRGGGTWVLGRIGPLAGCGTARACASPPTDRGKGKPRPRLFRTDEVGSLPDSGSAIVRARADETGRSWVSTRSSMCSPEPKIGPTIGRRRLALDLPGTGTAGVTGDAVGHSGWSGIGGPIEGRSARGGGLAGRAMPVGGIPVVARLAFSGLFDGWPWPDDRHFRTSSVGGRLWGAERFDQAVVVVEEGSFGGFGAAVRARKCPIAPVGCGPSTGKLLWPSLQWPGGDPRRRVAGDGIGVGVSEGCTANTAGRRRQARISSPGEGPSLSSALGGGRCYDQPGGPQTSCGGAPAGGRRFGRRHPDGKIMGRRGLSSAAESWPCR